MFEVEKQNGSWFVVNVPEYLVDGIPCKWYGPYDTKREADEAARVMLRWFKTHDPETLKKLSQESQ